MPEDGRERLRPLPSVFWYVIERILSAAVHTVRVAYWGIPFARVRIGRRPLRQGCLGETSGLCIENTAVGL